MKVWGHYTLAAALTVAALQVPAISQWVWDDAPTADERRAEIIAARPKCGRMYRVASEVAIFGCVTGRDGFDVVFKPCAGPPQTIPMARLEPTDFNCDDSPWPGA